jgi:hypothetical protein
MAKSGGDEVGRGHFLCPRSPISPTFSSLAAHINSGVPFNRSTAYCSPRPRSTAARTGWAARPDSDGTKLVGVTTFPRGYPPHTKLVCGVPLHFSHRPRTMVGDPSSGRSRASFHVPPPPQQRSSPINACVIAAPVHNVASRGLHKRRRPLSRGTSKNCAFQGAGRPRRRRSGRRLVLLSTNGPT